MVATVREASYSRVDVDVTNGLEVLEGVREDFYLLMCGEGGQCRMDDCQLCPHTSAGLICATGIYIYGDA
jgi:hypothetical protein